MSLDKAKSDVFEIRVNIQQFVLFCAKFSQCICKTSQQTFCVCCFEKFFFLQENCVMILLSKSGYEDGGENS